MRVPALVNGIITKTLSFLFATALPTTALAQGGPVVMGAGFRNPAAIKVAPGEVFKVFVNNVKTLLPYAGLTPIRIERATSVPLPTSLAGFSVRVQQGSKTYAAPIFSVEQVPICAYTIQNPIPPSTPDCWVTGVMIQIPFEILPQPIADLSSPVPVTTTLTVREGDMDSTAVALFPYTDNIHMVTTCGSNNVGLPTGDECGRTVTHADGSFVSPSAPAKPGESIVIQAYGLGQTTPAVKTGEATPSPAPVLAPSIFPFLGERMGLRFDFRVNAGPSRPYMNALPATPDQPPSPEFVGLTPGQVGLYQINVKLPDTFPPVEPCTTKSNLILSNLTISYGGISSFDGAGICVVSEQVALPQPGFRPGGNIKHR